MINRKFKIILHNSFSLNKKMSLKINLIKIPKNNRKNKILLKNFNQFLLKKEKKLFNN